MERQEFDAIVLGSGPGGYPAALRLAQGGKKVALVEALDIGGTCLNRGCIPSKTLIAGADLYRRMKQAELFGIRTQGLQIDFSSLKGRKDEVVAKLNKGLHSLLEASGIQLIKGFGSFTAPKEIQVATSSAPPLLLKGEKIVIATGSESKKIPCLPVDGTTIHDSTSLLNLTTLPEKLLVVGGGIIGCEFASFYRTFGTEVTIIEMLPSILPSEDEQISKTLAQAFQRRGINIVTGTQVKAFEKKGSNAVLTLEDGSSEEGSLVLVACGRERNTQNIGLEKAGITVHKNGSIPVNERMETSVPGIYAVGDVASNTFLAHVATKEGLVAASNALGEAASMDYTVIPSVIFTHPEIATVGLSEAKAKAKGIDAVKGAFPFRFLGKAQATAETDGFTQVVIDKKTGAVIGAQAVGHEAGTLIAEMALAIASELDVDCVEETIHAHPTLSEAWVESALIAKGTPLHVPKARQA